MNWKLAWPYALASAAAAVLLGAGISMLALTKDPAQKDISLQVGEPVTMSEFPPDFGSLAELVPFAGGVAPVSVDVAPTLHAPEFQDAAWVNAQDSGTYTIQVLAARDEEVVKRFLAGQEDRSQFVYFVYPQADGNWFVVTTGRFATHELAVSVAASRDFNGLSTKPFPRRFGVYQEALQAPVSSPPAASSPAVP
jgi:hypothetical protein